MTKEEKERDYAELVCGDYFSELLNNTDETVGHFTQKDYLAGYNQAVEDNKVEWMKQPRKMSEEIKPYLPHYELFEHISNEHGLILLNSELEEIIRIVLEINDKEK